MNHHLSFTLSVTFAALVGSGLTGHVLRQDPPAPPEVTQVAPEPTTTQPATAKPAHPAPGGGSMSADDLSIWNDPVFKRLFTQSYMAETDIEPHVTVTERETMQKVLEFMSGDRTNEALSMLNAHRNADASAVLDFTVANIYFQQDELDRAVQAYAIAVAKFPKFRRAWRNMALIYVRKGNYGEAVKTLIRVIELGENDAVTYGLLGYSYSNIDNSISAETAYRAAVMLAPDTLDWKMGLARSYFRQQRYADAIALTDIMIGEQPENIDLWMLQANAYVGLEKPLSAAENYEIVDQLGGSTPDSLTMLGDIYVNEELFDLAVEAYLRAVQMEPERSPERLVRASKVMTARGAMQEIKRLVDGIELHQRDYLEPEDHKDLLKLRARIAVAEGSAAEEAKILEEIVEIDPMDGEALILLGQYSARNNDPAKAAYYYTTAAMIEAFEADAKVRHAQLLVNEGNYSDAVPMLRRAQQLKPRENVQQWLEQVEAAARRQQSSG